MESTLNVNSNAGTSSSTGSDSKRKRKRQEATNEEDETYTLLRDSGCVSDWDDFLRDMNATMWVAPVDFFPLAPLSKIWETFANGHKGRKIEMKHPRAIGEIQVYCVATIIAFAGYKALVRYESMGNGPSMYGWISYCSDIPKPLGYSAAHSYLLLPVDLAEVGENYDETKQLDFVNRIYREVNISFPSFNSHLKTLRRHLAQRERNKKFKINQIVEVMDREHPVRNRLAVISCIVDDRIQVRYVGEDDLDPGFCCSIHSDQVHPLGWSQAIGQRLEQITENSRITFPRTISKKNFPPIPDGAALNLGMMFEVCHPCAPFKMAAGTVHKKLKHGYFVAKIETNDPRDYVEYVYHVTSENILPCGFCQRHNIPLEPPEAENDEFEWVKYFHETGRTPLLKQNRYQARTHKFVKGVKLEAIDKSEPFYLGPATVVNVAEHLLYIHFDGWPRNKPESYQWVSAFSCDIYPAGWAEMVGHRFQGHVAQHRPFDTYSISRHCESEELAKKNESTCAQP